MDYDRLAKLMYHQLHALAFPDYHKAYRDKNKERDLKRKKEYRTNNKGKIKEFNKIYRENNREKCNAWLREYRKNNRHAENIRKRRYRKKEIAKDPDYLGKLKLKERDEELWEVQ